MELKYHKFRLFSEIKKKKKKYFQWDDQGRKRGGVGFGECRLWNRSPKWLWREWKRDLSPKHCRFGFGEILHWHLRWDHHHHHGHWQKSPPISVLWKPTSSSSSSLALSMKFIPMGEFGSVTFGKPGFCKITFSFF